MYEQAQHYSQQSQEGQQLIRGILKEGRTRESLYPQEVHLSGRLIAKFVHKEEHIVCNPLLPRAL